MSSLIGGKSTFCQSLDEQSRQRRQLSEYTPIKSEGEAMWPFYTVCLRMRVLGVSRATLTHACFMCYHLDHIFVL